MEISVVFSDIEEEEEHGKRKDDSNYLRTKTFGRSLSFLLQV